VQKSAAILDEESYPANQSAMTKKQIKLSRRSF